MSPQQPDLTVNLDIDPQRAYDRVGGVERACRAFRESLEADGLVCSHPQAARTEAGEETLCRNCGHVVPGRLVEEEESG